MVCKKIAKINKYHIQVSLFFFFTKFTLCYTLIYPYIVYCNSAWSSTYVSNLDRNFFLQKRASCAGYHQLRRSSPFRSQNSSEQEFQIFSKSIRLKSPNACFIIKITALPPLLLNLLVTSSQIHGYDSRTASTHWGFLTFF